MDSDPLCIKLAKRHCAYVITVDNINKVDKAMIRSWRAQFPRANMVLVGGGWPCVNHSSLNKNRQGAEAATSRLLGDMLQVADELKKVSRPLRLPDWKVVEFYENVVMDEADLTTQSQKIGKLPVMNEAADILRCRRPRLYWLKGLEMILGSDLELLENQTVGELQTKLTVAKISSSKPPMEWFLRKDCKKFRDEVLSHELRHQEILQDTSAAMPKHLEDGEEIRIAWRHTNTLRTTWS